jgi:uncharacterized membrane protein YccC
VRAIGTVIGAVAIVMLIAIFPQSRYGMLIGLALWCAVCGAVASILRNTASYGAALAGFTAAVIFLDVVDDPANAFSLALIRVLEINIGLASAAAVMILTSTGDARLRLTCGLADAAAAIMANLTATLAGQRKNAALPREIIRRVVALDALIDEAIGEAAYTRRRAAILERGMEGLLVALSAWHGIVNHLEMTIDEERAALSPPDVLTRSLRAAAGDWPGDPEAMRAALGRAAEELEVLAPTDPNTQLLVDSVAEALRGLQLVANALVLIVAPGSEWRARRGCQPRVPDVHPAIVNGIRSFVALLFAEAIWVTMAWPGGQSIVAFTAVAVTVFSPEGDKAYRDAADYSAGTIVAFALALVVDFAVLPGQHSLFGFAVALGSVLLPAGMLSVRSRRKSFHAGLLVNFLAILAPANLPDYNLSTLLNTGVAVVAGTGVGSAAMLLLPPPSPGYRIGRLLALTRRDVRRLATRRRWPSRADWISLVSWRIEAMPEVGSSPQALSELLAALTVGEAVIWLRDTRPLLARPEHLNRALAALAVGHLASARDWFNRLGSAQLDDIDWRSAPRLRASASATLIVEALQRHVAFFADVRDWRDPG